MAVNNTKVRSVYGIGDDIIEISPSPIVSKRNPTANDKAPIGQMWVNKAVNTVYFLSQITAGAAVWSQAASTVGDLTVGGTIHKDF